jgi:glutaredoxin
MITVVTNGPCPWCVKVKGLLRMHDIQFQEWEPEFRDLQVVLADHHVATVPQVFLDDPRSHLKAKRIGGYEDTLKWINGGMS